MQDTWIRSPGLGRFLIGVNGIPLQYSCLENPMDGGAWWVTVLEVTEIRTQLSDWARTTGHDIQWKPFPKLDVFHRLSLVYLSGKHIPGGKGNKVGWLGKSRSPWFEKNQVLVIQLCPTLCDPCTQSPLSMEFSRQEYWSGLSFPSPGNLPNQGIEPRSPALPADFFTIWA